MLLLILLVSCLFKSPLKEGITFTNYDNSNLLLNHWDHFCTQPGLACKNDDNFLLVERNPPIGCWCKDQYSTLLGPECTDINYDPFVEFRR